MRHSTHTKYTHLQRLHLPHARTVYESPQLYQCPEKAQRHAPLCPFLPTLRVCACGLGSEIYWKAAKRSPGLHARSHTRLVPARRAQSYIRSNGRGNECSAICVVRVHAERGLLRNRRHRALSRVLCCRPPAGQCSRSLEICKRSGNLSVGVRTYLKCCMRSSRRFGTRDPVDCLLQWRPHIVCSPVLLCLKRVGIRGHCPHYRFGAG